MIAKVIKFALVQTLDFVHMQTYFTTKM